MKYTDFKPGQLVTINHVVYKCTRCEHCAECKSCDIRNDIEDRVF